MTLIALVLGRVERHLWYLKPNAPLFAGHCGPVRYCSHTRQWCSPSGDILNCPQASEVKQSLPCLPQHRVSMQRSGQALCDVDTKVFQVVHPLRRGLIDLKVGIVPSLLLPKVHYQLLSLADGHKEGVVLTPAGQALYLLYLSLSMPPLLYSSVSY